MQITTSRVVGYTPNRFIGRSRDLPNHIQKIFPTSFLRHFGFHQSRQLQPILVRPMGARWQIIFGHGRVSALKRLQREASTEEDRSRFSKVRAEERTTAAAAPTSQTSATASPAVPKKQPTASNVSKAA